MSSKASKSSVVRGTVGTCLRALMLSRYLSVRGSVRDVRRSACVRVSCGLLACSLAGSLARSLLPMHARVLAGFLACLLGQPLLCDPRASWLSFPPLRYYFDYTKKICTYIYMGLMQLYAMI